MFILTYCIILQEIVNVSKAQSDDLGQSFPHRFQFILDQQIKAIVQISSHQNFDFNFGVLAEMKKEGYTMYQVEYAQIFVNSILKPKFEIVNQIQFFPKNGENCYGFIFELNDEIIFCLYQQELRFYKLRDQDNYSFYDLNYTDQINMIEIKAESTYIGIYINLHESNWEIQVLQIKEFPLMNTQANIYRSQDFQNQPNLIVKKAIIISYYELYLLTTNNQIYLYGFDIKTYFLPISQNELILDFMINQQGELIILRRIYDICQVDTIIFDCYSNDLQLILFDNQDFYVMENNKQIISPLKNITISIDQQKFYILSQHKFILFYDNDSNISFIDFEIDDSQNTPQFQNSIYDYEYDNTFLNQTHIIKFREFSSNNFLMTPYTYGPPFSLKVLDDPFQLIHSIDQPTSKISCLNGTQNYQFLKLIKLITKNTLNFIYQWNYQVYFQNCDIYYNFIPVLIRNNQQIIQHFAIHEMGQDQYIIFDDFDGKELYLYKVERNYLKSTEINFIEVDSIQSEKQIKSISRQFESIIIYHIDNSITLINQENNLNSLFSPRFKSLKQCLLVAQVKKYTLCVYNKLSEAIIELLFIESEAVYQLNRYNIQNYSIIDLAKVQDDKFLIIVKSNLDQVSFLWLYQIKNIKLYFMGDILKDLFEPQKIEDKSLAVISVLALNSNRNSYLLVFNFAMEATKYFLKYIPYPKYPLFLNQNSLVISEKIVDENNQYAWKFEEYQLGRFFMSFQMINQNQYKQNYTVSIQIDNLISSKIIELHFVGLDYSSQLLLQEITLPIKAQDIFQKISLNSYFYGPIHKVVCIRNCALSQLVIYKNSIQYDQLTSIQAAIIVGNQLFFQLQGQHYISEIENNLNIGMPNISVRKQAFINYGILKSPDTTIPQLIVVIYSNMIDCQLKIDIYQFQSSQIVNQFSQTNPEIKLCSLQLKIKNNIFLVIDHGQLLVYRYNFIINQFQKIEIQNSNVEPLSFTDYDSYENQLFLVRANHTSIQIIQINLLTQLVVFQYTYLMKISTTQSIQILKVTKNKIQIMYSYITTAQILHFQISQNKIESVNIQELIIDRFVLKIVPTYHNEHLILFKSIYLEKSFMKQNEMTLLFFINEKENYSFPSRTFYSANYILHVNENTFIYINSTSIGQIEINNFYEIQVNAKEIIIEVSNMQTTVQMTLKTQLIQNQTRIQVLVISGWLGVLILVQFHCYRKNKLKYINLY